MTKYVCDFDAIKDVCIKIDNSANVLTDEVNNIKQSADIGHLEWQGVAATNFNNSITNQSELILKNINNLQDMSQFLKHTSDSIAELEAELSNMKI